MVTMPRHPVRRVSSQSFSASSLNPDGVRMVCCWPFFVWFVKYGVPVWLASAWALSSRAFALSSLRVSGRIFIVSLGLRRGFW